MKKEKGITLIALVITIIVLLILAGVSLNLIASSDGILGKTTSAVSKSKEASAKEQVELLVKEYQMEYYEKKYNEENDIGTGKDYILEKFKEGISIDSYYVQTNEEEMILNVYEGKDGLGKLLATVIVQENGSIEWGDIVEGINVSYSLEPQGYTNGNVELTINASSTNGTITEIQGSIDKNETGAYIVTENGNYEFTVKDSSGASRTKVIEIHTIDRTAPKEANIFLSADEENHPINATITLEDEESGIDLENSKWIYTTMQGSLGTESANYENTFTSNPQEIELEREKNGTYYLHVLSQDNAGNKKETISDAIEEKLKRVYLLKDGVLNQSVTGSVMEAAQRNAVPTVEYVEGEGINFSNISYAAQYTFGGFTFEKQIDLTGYSKIFIEYEGDVPLLSINSEPDNMGFPEGPTSEGFYAISRAVSKLYWYVYSTKSTKIINLYLEQD